MHRTSVLSAILLLAVAFTLISREPASDPRLKKASRQPEHAGWIQVHLEGVDLSIRVTDNGSGLPAGWRQPGHYGVLGMRERAVALGGSFELQKPDSGGVCVSARIPLHAEPVVAA